MISARPVGRRAVLRLGVGGAALLAVGGGLGAWVTSGYAALLGPIDAPIALSTKELAVVRALVDALFPAVDGFPSGLSLGLHQRVDEEVWATSDANRRALKSGLQLLEHLPPLYGHPHRFTALSPDARVSVFGAMLVSKVETIRQIAFALKQVTHLLYYADERVWPLIHYDGVFVETPRPPDSAYAYEKLLHGRRDA